MLRRCPKFGFDIPFNVFKPHNIAGKPKPFEKTFQDLNIVLDL